MKNSETITGVVHRIIFAAPGGFHVISLKKEPSAERVVVIGDLVGIKPGLRVKMTGEWQTNKKHGKQFKASQYTEIHPTGKDGLEKYLSGYFRGIGPTLARRIVNYFKESTLDILDGEIEKLLEVPGIGPDKLRKIESEWKKKKHLAEIMVFLRTLGFGPENSRKILLKYGLETGSIIQEDPYRLIRDIHGIGFQTADKVAKKLSMPADSPLRIKAAILYELFNAEEEGHCCLLYKELLRKTAIRLGIETDRIRSFVRMMVEEKELIIRDDISRQGALIFRSAVDRVEREAAACLVRLVKAHVKPMSWNVSELCRTFSAQTGMEPVVEQVDVLEKVKNCAVTVITGGPGTGKTTIVKLVTLAFRAERIRLAAPTGRAAQRLSEATGKPASTIHRMLIYNPQANHFVYNAQNKLPADIIIIDESSMLDIFLLAALLRAVRPGCRMLFVGDADQLPSVGPGRVLADLIRSREVSVVRLKHIFRQKNNSRIIRNAYNILSGHKLEFGVSGDGGDFFFIEKETPEEILEMIKKLPKKLSLYLNVDPIDDIQILCPMYKGNIGVDHLNSILQDILNPSGKPILSGRKSFRIGDKVMQIKNNYSLDIFNGDIGRIVSINDDEDRININFGDKIVSYATEFVNQLVLAYACSIHKSQGSEYAGVIIPLHTQHYVMLKRQLLYTAVTRGKRMVIIVGSVKALHIAVNNVHEDTRCSLLAQRITENMKNF